MNSSGLVELAVYDLSRGMAKQFISSYLGIDVEAIYHTGVRVYGYEYFFSDGIQKMKPEEVILFNIIYTLNPRNCIKPSCLPRLPCHRFRLVCIS